MTRSVTPQRLEVQEVLRRLAESDRKAEESGRRFDVAVVEAIEVLDESRKAVSETKRCLIRLPKS